MATLTTNKTDEQLRLSGISRSAGQLNVPEQSVSNERLEPSQVEPDFAAMTGGPGGNRTHDRAIMSRLL